MLWELAELARACGRELAERARWPLLAPHGPSLHAPVLHLLWQCCCRASFCQAEWQGLPLVSVDAQVARRPFLLHALTEASQRRFASPLARVARHPFLWKDLGFRVYSAVAPMAWQGC